MSFKIIDLEKYDRKEHFIHYLNNVPCSYSMTVNIDITDLLKLTKERNYKLYPVILYAITKVVNNHIEFRMSLDENDNLGYYINVNPSYTIFHKDNNTFSNIWTKYDSSFEKFYNNYEKDIYKSILNIVNKYSDSNYMDVKEILFDDIDNIKIKRDELKNAVNIIDFKSDLINDNDLDGH